MTKNKYLPEGSLLFTRENREYLGSLASLERAKGEGKILEAIATKCDSSTLNLEVDLNGIKGIIYKEDCLLEDEIKDIAIITRVGKAVAFKVMGIEKDEKGKPLAILSRKEAQRDCLNNYLLDLIPGDIIPAKITHFEPFGAFLDIGCGISSLMSIDSVSVSRIESPRDRFDGHEEIKVVVKSIDYETGRIYVSTKELFGTWEENVSSFSAGQTVSGIVRSIESYGIFVELSPNLAGLAELKENVNVGDGCAVYIKSIIPEKMKIKLVIIDTYDKVVRENPKKHYYIDTDKVSHIDKWIYSPPNSQKVIETVFTK
ncbi:MAG: S1 RNA-binding domain-containing protein [Clostridia bacterium]|nr:S1 RNA-binding domain-containing protein [Clostridia bacterium]